jgi:hypothetical protein
MGPWRGGDGSRRRVCSENDPRDRFAQRAAMPDEESRLARRSRTRGPDRPNPRRRGDRLIGCQKKRMGDSGPKPGHEKIALDGHDPSRARRSWKPAAAFVRPARTPAVRHVTKASRSNGFRAAREGQSFFPSGLPVRAQCRQGAFGTAGAGSGRSWTRCAGYKRMAFGVKEFYSKALRSRQKCGSPKLSAGTSGSFEVQGRLCNGPVDVRPPETARKGPFLASCRSA